MARNKTAIEMVQLLSLYFHLHASINVSKRAPTGIPCIFQQSISLMRCVSIPCKLLDYLSGHQSLPENRK